MKYEANNACVVTGEVTNDNKMYFNGKIILSANGAESLLDELKTL
jgi:transcriptional pleiotropic regulator of transition state genes